jgi:hypothetical protein
LGLGFGELLGLVVGAGVFVTVFVGVGLGFAVEVTTGGPVTFG